MILQRDMGKIRDLMALELETYSLNQEESTIFDFNRRVDAGPSNEEPLLLGKSPAELEPSPGISCSSTKIDPSRAHYASTDESDVGDTVSSYSDAYDSSNKVCSWDSLQSSLQSVFPNDAKYTYVIESYKEKKLETFVGAPDHAFEVQARINVFSEKEAREWLSKFFEHSNCSYI